MERIGMVQSLFYFETGKIWESFFEQAGYEIVRSASAEQVTADVSEACQPIRTCIGHVQNLIDRHVDWIFLPRVVSYAKGYCSCPKIQGVCDTARMMLPKGIGILEPVIDARQGRYFGVYQIGCRLGIPARSVKYLYKEALKQNVRKAYVPIKPYIAVLGHPYVLKDPLLGQKILQQLGEAGYTVVTAEEQPEELLLEKGRALQPRKMFWYTGQKQIGFCQMLMECTEPPEGILYISVFGCGIDDYIWPYCERLVQGRRPFLHLKLDQQYYNGGIQTRLEAFQDMLERSRVS